MKVLTTRVEEKEEKDVEEIRKAEKAERSEVIRRLLARGVKDWKTKNALERLKNRETSIAKAAEIAQVSYADMLDLMEKENIDIGYSIIDLEKDIKKLKK